MTYYKTRSKQNSGLKGAVDGGSGGKSDGEGGGAGQQKDAKRAPKTPTRSKGKRGAVATPKGASKPDSAKPRTGGTTPDGRKLKGVTKLAATAGAKGTGPYELAAEQRRATTVAGTIESEAAAAGMTPQEFAASQMSALKEMEAAKANEEAEQTKWEQLGDEEAVAKLEAKLGEEKMDEGDDGSFISGGSFDALVGEDDDEDDDEDEDEDDSAAEEEAKNKAETTADSEANPKAGKGVTEEALSSNKGQGDDPNLLQVEQPSITREDQSVPKAGDAIRGELAAEEKNTAGQNQDDHDKEQQEATKEVAQKTATVLNASEGMDIDTGATTDGRSKAAKPNPSSADPRGAEEQDEDEDMADDDGKEDDDETMEYDLGDFGQQDTRLRSLQQIKELTNRAKEIISAALVEVEGRKNSGDSATLQIPGTKLKIVVEYMARLGLFCPKWIFPMLTEDFPDHKHFYSLIRLIADLVEDTRKEKEKHDWSLETTNDDEARVGADGINMRLEQAESALAVLMRKREEVADDIKEGRDQSCFLLCPGMEKICGFALPEGQGACAKNPKKDESCSPLHSQPKCELDETKVYCVHQTSLQLDLAPVCSLDDLLAHGMTYDDLDGLFFLPSGLRRIRSLMARPDLTKIDRSVFQDVMAMAQSAHRARHRDDRQLLSLGFNAPSVPKGTLYAQAAAQPDRPPPVITLHNGGQRQHMSRITVTFTHSSPPPNETNHDRKIRAITDLCSLISKACFFVENDPNVVRLTLVPLEPSAQLPSFALNSKDDLAANFVTKMSDSPANIAFIKHFFGRKFNVALASTRRRQTASLALGHDGTEAGHQALVEAFEQGAEELEELSARARGSLLQRHSQAFPVGYLLRLEPDAGVGEIIGALEAHAREAIQQAGASEVDVEIAIEAEVVAGNRKESTKFWENVRGMSGPDKSASIAERKVQAIYSNSAARHAVATAATKIFRPKSSASMLQQTKLIFISSTGSSMLQYNVEATRDKLFLQQRFLNRTQYQQAIEIPTIRPSRLFSSAGSSGLSIYSLILGIKVPTDPANAASPRISPYLNVFVSITSGALMVRAKPQYHAQAAAAAGILHLLVAQQLEDIGASADLRYLLTIDGLISHRQMRLDPVTMRVTMIDEESQTEDAVADEDDEDIVAIDRLLREEESTLVAPTSPASNMRRVRFSGADPDAMSINTEISREAPPDVSSRRGAEVSAVLARLDRMGRHHEREAQRAIETKSVLSEISVRTHELRQEITSAARKMVQEDNHKPATKVLSKIVAEVREAGLQGKDVRPFLDSASLQEVAGRLIDGVPTNDDLKALKIYNVAVAAACIDALEEQGKPRSQEGTVIDIDDDADDTSVVGAVSTDSALNLLRPSTNRISTPVTAPSGRANEDTMRREWAAIAELVRTRSTSQPVEARLQEELKALNISHLEKAEVEAVRKHKILLESDFIRLDLSPPPCMQGSGWLDRSTITPASEAGSAALRDDGGKPSTN